MLRSVVHLLLGLFIAHIQNQMSVGVATDLAEQLPWQQI